MAFVKISVEQWRRVWRNMLAFERTRELDEGKDKTPAYPVAMRLQSVQEDYITCRTWLGDVLGTTDIKVAKPEELRKAPFAPVNTTGDGKTYSYTSGTARTVTQAPTTESQIIIPAYRLPSGPYKGSLIFAQPAISGGTSLVLNPGTQTEERVYFLDLNVDGRAWARV